jgi:hypothetical protein
VEGKGWKLDDLQYYPSVHTVCAVPVLRSVGRPKAVVTTGWSEARH